MLLGVLALAVGMAAVEPIAAVEDAPSGQASAPDRPRRPRFRGDAVRKVSYGDPQTITCFQGGAILFQHVGAYFVKSETGRNWMKLSYKLNGQRRRLDVPASTMTCLIEEVGEESVPIMRSTVK